MLYYINTISPAVCVIVLIFTAFYVLIKNRGGQSPVYYFWYNISGAMIMLSIFLTYYFYDSKYTLLFARMSQASTIIFSAAFFNLSLTYPEKQKKIKWYITTIAAMPAILIAALILKTDYSISAVRFENLTPIRTYGFLYYIYASLSFLYFLASMFVFIYNYVKTKVETFRLQIRYVIFATSIFIIFTYTGSIFLPLFYNNYTFYVIAPTLTSIATTVTLFYSIIAYNLMNIRTAIFLTMRYFALTSVFFAPVIAAIFASDFISDRYKIYPEITSMVIAAVFLTLTIILQRWINRTYRRGSYNIEELTNKYIKKAEKLKTINELIETSATYLYKELSLARVIFFLYDEEDRNFKIFFDTSKDKNSPYIIERYSPLVKWFARNQKILTEDRIYRDDEYFKSIRDEIAEFINKYDIGFIMPIYYENRLLGMLCPGKRVNGKNLPVEEILSLEDFRTRLNDFLIAVMAYDKAKKDKFISRSLELSSNILDSAIIKSVPNISGLRVSFMYAPRYQRGCDYLDFLHPTENTLAMLCTDVSGIGIHNALYSVIFRSVFHSCINEAASPYAMMKRINLVIHEYTKGAGELVTAFYCFIDIKNKRIYYSNAGFPPMDVYRIDKNDFDTLDTEGSPLGYDPMSEYGEATSEFKSGDICVLYSKSIINSKNSAGENFGLLRLRNLVKENKAKNPADIIKNIKDSYERFMGISLPTSDLTLVVTKIQ